MSQGVAGDTPGSGRINPVRPCEPIMMRSATPASVEPWVPIKALTSSVCDDVRWFVTAAGVFKVQTTR